MPVYKTEWATDIERRQDGYYVTARLIILGRPHRETRDIGPVDTIEEAEKLMDEVHAAVRVGIELAKAQIRARKD